MLAHILLLAGGFGALYFGAEWLVRGSAQIASDLGISPVVVGLTVVSLGTSAPEMVVGVIATLESQGGLLMGNVLGSNLANIGLILGATALINPLPVADRVTSRDVPVMIMVVVLAFPLVLDMEVDRGDGIILAALLVVYIAFTFRTADEDADRIHEDVGVPREGSQDTAGTNSMLANIGLVVAGATGLALGGQATVGGATFVAGALGASPALIGLTVIAIGTSLPELVTSIVAATRKQTDIAVGNIVGSNIFNVTAVMAVAALVRGYPITQETLRVQLPAVLVFSLLVWPITATGSKVRRREGLFLLLCYAGFMSWITILD